MPTELPHATQIRALRHQVELATRARILLPELEGALTNLALGGPGTAADRLHVELRSEWPDFDLQGDQYADLTRARSLLHTAIATGEHASRQMNELLHAQSHALRQEDFAEIRNELFALSDKRSGLSASLAPLATTLASLEPLIPAIQTQLDAIDPTGPEDKNGRARLIGLAHSIEPVLRMAQVDIELPAVRPDTPIGTTIDAFRALGKRLAMATESMRAQKAALTAELRGIEDRMQARTG